jgi:hypothetical protein
MSQARNGAPKPRDVLDISEYRTYKTPIDPDDLLTLFAVGSRVSMPWSTR